MTPPYIRGWHDGFDSMLKKTWMFDTKEEQESYERGYAQGREDFILRLPRANKPTEQE